MRPGFVQRFIARLVINIGAFFAAVYLVPQIHSQAWQVTLTLAAAYAVIVITLMPILSFIMGLMSIFTVVLYTIVLNAALLYAAGMLADELDLFFEIDEPQWGVVGAVAISAIVLVGTAIFRQFVRGM